MEILKNPRNPVVSHYTSTLSNEMLGFNSLIIRTEQALTLLSILDLHSFQRIVAALGIGSFIYFFLYFKLRKKKICFVERKEKEEKNTIILESISSFNSSLLLHNLLVQILDPKLCAQLSTLTFCDFVCSVAGQNIARSLIAILLAQQDQGLDEASKHLFLQLQEQCSSYFSLSDSVQHTAIKLLTRAKVR